MGHSTQRPRSRSLLYTTVGRFDVLDVLDELVAKSMLMVEPTPEGTTRYQLLETLRQYALERLEQSGEVDMYRRRHAEHYVSVTAEIGGCALWI